MTLRLMFPLLGFASAVAAGWFLATAFPASQVARDHAAVALAPGAVPHPSLAGQTPEDLALSRIRGLKDRWDAITGAVALARSLSPAQQLAWLKAGTFQHSDPRVVNVFTNELQEQLLSSDPYALLELLATLDRYSFKRFQEKLAKRDPEGFVAHARGLEDPAKRDSLLLLASDWLAEHEPEALLELVIREGLSRRHQPAILARMLVKAAAGDERKLLAMADSQGDIVRPLLRSAAAGVLLEKDMAGGLRWLKGEPDGALLFATITFNTGLDRDQWRRVNRKVAENLGELDLEFVEKIQESHQNWPRMGGMRDAEELWLRADLDSLLPPEARDDVRKEAVTDLFRRDQREAMKWLMNDEVIPQPWRAEILKGVLSYVLDGKPLHPEVVPMIDAETRDQLGLLLEAKAATTLKPVSQATIREVMATPEGVPDRDGFSFIRKPLETWTGAEIAEARSFVKGQDEKDLQSLLIRQDYSSTGFIPIPVSAEIYRSALEKNLSSKNMVAGVIMIASEWARSEPAKAAAWVESLPPGQARTFAIKNVAARWTVQSAPEAEQWIAGLSDPAELQAALEAAAIAEEK